MKLPIFATVVIGLTALTFAGCASSGIPETGPVGLSGGFKTYNFTPGKFQDEDTTNQIRIAPLKIGNSTYSAFTGEIGIERYSVNQSYASLPPDSITVNFYDDSSGFQLASSTARRKDPIDSTVSLSGGKTKVGVWHYNINPVYSGITYTLNKGAIIRVEIEYSSQWEATVPPTQFYEDGASNPIPINTDVVVTTFALDFKVTG